MGKTSKGHKKQTPKKRQTQPKKSPIVSAPIVFPDIEDGKKSVLHFDGGKKNSSPLLDGFQGKEWQPITISEDSVRLADITLALSAMDKLPKACVDAVWLPGILQRLSYHEVVPFLHAIHTLLKPEGIIALSVPDMMYIAENMDKKGFERPLKKEKQSPALIDYVFGGRRIIAEQGKQYQHHTGFVSQSLANRLMMSKFSNIIVRRDGLQLFARGTRVDQVDEKQRPNIIGPDLNDMMRARDEIDQPPARWKNPSL